MCFCLQIVYKLSTNCIQIHTSLRCELCSLFEALSEVLKHLLQVFEMRFVLCLKVLAEPGTDHQSEASRTGSKKSGSSYRKVLYTCTYILCGGWGVNAQSYNGTCSGNGHGAPPQTRMHIRFHCSLRLQTSRKCNRHTLRNRCPTAVFTKSDHLLGASPPRSVLVAWGTSLSRKASVSLSDILVSNDLQHIPSDPR